MENDLISRAWIYRQLCMSTDKDGALKRIPDTDCDNFPIMLHIRDVRRAILKAPAVDAVQIGRCGTCKKAMTKDCPLYGFDENGYCTGGPGSDYYCADYESEEGKQ